MLLFKSPKFTNGIASLKDISFSVPEQEQVPVPAEPESKAKESKHKRNKSI